jgi:hypothetical protein
MLFKAGGQALLVYGVGFRTASATRTVIHAERCAKSYAEYEYLYCDKFFSPARGKSTCTTLGHEETFKNDLRLATKLVINLDHSDIDQ